MPTWVGCIKVGTTKWDDFIHRNTELPHHQNVPSNVFPFRMCVSEVINQWQSAVPKITEWWENSNCPAVSIDKAHGNWWFLSPISDMIYIHGGPIPSR